MKKSVLITLLVILAIAIAGGSFWAGMSYGNSQATTATATARANFAGRAGRMGGATSGAGFVSGSIISKDPTSITISSAGGGSKIIFYSNTTQIGKMTTGTADDLSTGKNVMITGTTNSDGSITAQSIQIRPAQAQ